jgi:hypothetical protein
VESSGGFVTLPSQEPEALVREWRATRLAGASTAAVGALFAGGGVAIRSYQASVITAALRARTPIGRRVPASASRRRVQGPVLSEGSVPPNGQLCAKAASELFG